MKQDTENQYDDDLTLGTDEYDDSYYTDADDLFEFSTNDESPISRLKSLVLSIDWEITDEVLLQFNEELIDLKGIWADDNINLVYVQALEKISKYIYQNKANSHPNSIKLLLTLYYNLEKIVSSQDLSEAQKKEILLEDVKRFEVLKRQIAQKSKPVPEPPPAQPEIAQVKKDATGGDKLLNLKAIVLGIDWEITDQDLNDLRREVVRLEEQFADSRPKLILLQGIGTLGAYIKMKKSNSHADAFKVLHLFYESLEKIVQTPMSLAEEKSILFPAVEKFNAFKALLGPTISPEAINRSEEEDEDEDEGYVESTSGEIAPALADISDEEAIGFQAEEEAKSLGFDAGAGGVASHIDDFFGESFAPAAEEAEVSTPADTDQVLDEEEVISVLGFEDDAAAVLPSIDRDIALQGVDVEADDEEVSEPAAAAFGSDEDAVAGRRGEMSGDAAESVLLTFEDEEPAEKFASDEEVARVADSLFADNEAKSPEVVLDFGGLDRNVALKGVDVETEADEDSDEISLPMEGEEFAPALGASEEVSIFSAETLESTIASGGISEELGGTLDDLFLEEEKIHTFADVETAIEEEITEIASSPAESSEDVGILEQVGGEEAEKPVEIAGAQWEPEFAETEVGEEEAVESLQEPEEELSLFFTGSDLEQSAEESAEVDTLFESLEPVITEEEEEEITTAEADEQIDAFFDLKEAPEAPGEEKIFVVPVTEEGPTEAETEESAYAAQGISEVDTLFESLEPATVEADVAESVFVEADERVDAFFDLKEVPEAPGEEKIFVVPVTEEGPTEAETEESAYAAQGISEVDTLFESLEPATVEADIAESVFVEADERVDAFFDREEAPGKPDEEKLFVSPAAEEVSTEAEVSPYVAEEISEEEEVVFELAEEPVEAALISAATTDRIFATEAPEVELADEVAESISIAPVFVEADQEDSALAFAAAEFISDTREMPSDSLEGLRTCVESLGIELDDKVIMGLFQEINSLRQKWSDKPLEKTFLQLLSTITQHIDQYRYEASSDAFNLLQSVCKALADRREDDIHSSQELLLTETLKVLEWQQGMLARQAVQKGAQLTFAAPVRTEGEEIEGITDAQDAFDQQLQHYGETVEVDSLSADEPSRSGQQANFPADEAEPDVAAMAEPLSEQKTELSKEAFADELKQEIASLRLTLQKEIAELRSELKGM